MTLHTLRGRETHTERRRIDAVGLALLVIGIGSLQIMLDRGKGWTGSPRGKLSS